MPVLAANVVAASQPLAAQAGLQMLLRGGNAVDAVLAAAITLTVVEPTSNGLGSDAFAILWDGANLYGLNGSGRAPGALSAERFAGLDRMPMHGWDAVTVPGAVDAWVELSSRFGKLPFEDLFAPAIRYARDGFLVSPITALQWSFAPEIYKDYPEFGRTFLIGGRAPKAGELFRCPNQAKTLEAIGGGRSETFYRGELAEKMVENARISGGLMALEDLAEHSSEWVEPISVQYRAVRVHEIPPNGQGLAALIALGILGHFDLKRYPVDSPESIHLQVEAMKVGFAEAHRHISDPAFMVVKPEAFLEESFLGDCAGRIRMDRAAFPESAVSRDHGTVYLAAADESGMMVSFIQSNFRGFGSGIVIPDTGISLQNRGHGFSLVEGHPNRVGGGKRPYHTIIPGFVTKDGEPLMSFGVMGGHMQPQGHVQMITRIFDYAQNPQSASDGPRWYLDEDFSLVLESDFASSTADGLRLRGHTVIREPLPRLFGGAQLVYRLDSGYCAASDHRKDGQPVGF
jgi:gamma-glutamyltranspeptidase/glutathione hydrolase